MKTQKTSSIPASVNVASASRTATRYGLFHRTTGARVWENYEFTSLTQAAIFIVTHDLHVEAKPI